MANGMTPQELADKWARRLKGSIDDIRAGVERVQEAPGKAAAAKADKWQQRISEAATRDKWARRVGAVSLDDWKQAITTKGLSRIAAGVDGAQSKMERFAEQLLTHQASLQSQISDMPDLTLEDSINRMGAWVRGMAKFQVRD